MLLGSRISICFNNQSSYCAFNRTRKSKEQGTAPWHPALSHAPNPPGQIPPPPARVDRRRGVLQQLLGRVCFRRIHEHHHQRRHPAFLAAGLPVRLSQRHAPRHRPDARRQLRDAWPAFLALPPDQFRDSYHRRAGALWHRLAHASFAAPQRTLRARRDVARVRHRAALGDSSAANGVGHVRHSTLRIVDGHVFSADAVLRDPLRTIRRARSFGSRRRSCRARSAWAASRSWLPRR